MSNVKHRGQVFTPVNIVNLMLDKIEYCDDNIQCNSILEPSFGDGAFLCEIVNRIIDYSALYNLTKNEIYEILDNVYGIELDVNLYTATIEKLNTILHRYDLIYDWPHLYNMDALQYNSDVQFDYIIGNPPYVKIQNLDVETRKNLSQNYQFCSGNTDLYIAFFEKCISMLAKNGKLAFITPNSYFKNTSQKSFRQFLTEHNYIEEIVDYGSYKVFDNADTYTAITFIKNNKANSDIHYCLMKDVQSTKYSVIISNTILDNTSWTFPSREDLDFLQDNANLPHRLADVCRVSHGVSTNADNVYIITPEHFDEFEPGMLRSIVKASTLNDNNKIIFPYKWNRTKKKYEVVPENILSKKYPKTYAYLLANKEQLLKRDMEKGALWYQYARSQGLNYVNKTKLVIKHIASVDSGTIQTCIADKDTIVYSGMYIVADSKRELNKIKRLVESQSFYKYSMIVGKNMANGYKSINTKSIKNYGIENEVFC